MLTLCAPRIFTSGATARTRLAQPRPTDVHDEGRETRQFAENLESDSALSGEQHLAEAGIDERRPVFLSERLRRVHRGVVMRLRRIERGAECGDAVTLHLRRVRRNEDRRRNSEMLRGVRDAQPVIARGRCNDARPPLFGRERGDHVQRAAELERAGGLRVLELEVDVAAREIAQGRAPNQLRASDERPNAVGGGENVGWAEVGEHAVNTSAAGGCERVLSSRVTFHPPVSQLDVLRAAF